MGKKKNDLYGRVYKENYCRVVTIDTLEDGCDPKYRVVVWARRATKTGSTSTPRLWLNFATSRAAHDAARAAHYGDISPLFMSLTERERDMVVSRKNVRRRNTYRPAKRRSLGTAGLIAALFGFSLPTEV